MLEKKGNTNTVTCCECGNTDDDRLLLIRDAPWVIECMVCGHPNDARWDGDMDDVYSA